VAGLLDRLFGTNAERLLREARYRKIVEVASRNRRFVYQVARALSDSDGSLRERAAEALERIGEPAAEPLIGALSHSDSDVRWKAARALAIMSWKPTREEERAAYLLACRQWDELVKVGEPAVGALLRALRGSGLDCAPEGG
jgi:HEAT repeat protein